LTTHDIQLHNYSISVPISARRVASAEVSALAAWYPEKNNVWYMGVPKTKKCHIGFEWF
jgi:predicted phosphoadenosine phosphosulfate sulfurtransferase